MRERIFGEAVATPVVEHPDHLDQAWLGDLEPVDQPPGRLARTDNGHPLR